MIITEHSTLLEIANEVTATAVEHGWWETERSDLLQMLLISSEVYEAFERYRKAPEDSMMLEVSKELVDVVIRILDHVGHTKLTAQQVRELDLLESHAPIGVLAAYYDEQQDGDTPIPTDVVEFLGLLAASFHADYDATKLHSDMKLSLEELLGAVGAITWWITEVAQQDFVALLQSKMDENRNRPYRHGGRRA